MSLPDRKHLPHEKPSWVKSGACYFVTICTHPRGHNQLTATPHTAKAILDSIEHYHTTQTWWVHVAVLMPDHLHALLVVSPDKKLTTSIAAWKAWQAKTHNISWQSGFFDHRLRNAESLQQKATYIRQNPVRAGLATKPEDWPHVFLPR